MHTYYSQNYAGIIYLPLSVTLARKEGELEDLVLPQPLENSD